MDRDQVKKLSEYLKASAFDRLNFFANKEVEGDRPSIDVVREANDLLAAARGLDELL